MYHITVLSRESGFSRRTIHYYRERGLLSPPLKKESRTVTDVWGDVHIRELRRIREMQEANLTLDEMAERLHGAHV